MLEQLAKKNNKWLKMAFNLCGNYNLSADLVQDMYIRMYDISKRHPDKEIKDTYVWVVLTTLLNDRYRRHSKYKNVSLDNVLNKPDNIKQFELDDKSLELMNLAKDFRYLHRYWLTLSYDYSIREIADISGVNYGEVYRTLRLMREHILKDDISEYDRKVKKRSEAGKISIRPKKKDNE